MCERDEQAIRADERRRMDQAINWGTSCLGCADRLDALIAERYAGQADAARAIADRLRVLYAETGDRAHLIGVTVAEQWLRDRPESPAGGLVGASVPSADGPPA